MDFENRCSNYRLFELELDDRLMLQISTHVVMFFVFCFSLRKIKTNQIFSKISQDEKNINTYRNYFYKEAKQNYNKPYAANLIS